MIQNTNTTLPSNDEILKLTDDEILKLQDEILGMTVSAFNDRRRSIKKRLEEIEKEAKLLHCSLQIFNDIYNNVIYLKDEDIRLIWKNTKTNTWDYVGALIIPSIPNKPIPRHFDPANINNDI